MLEAKTVEQIAKYIEPEGVQQLSEVKEILFKNPEYAERLAKYCEELDLLMEKIEDPKTKITPQFEHECQRLDEMQDELAKQAPDGRIHGYLVAKGHLLESKNPTDPHYKAVLEARKERSFFHHAAQYVDPQGGAEFKNIRLAFTNHSFYTGEFVAYKEAERRIRKELIERREKVDQKRLSLFDELLSELTDQAPHPLIKTHLENSHKKLKELNERI
ncbi:MAG: hypothetical protein S4CHLAM45_12380 [Chlamydiales bacterium]|nr:hypothetical protein [Chlamydiales bacterium]MCH9619727.1 hypothetical protein [Chlamydiales bacterium]MCH9623333.1 hypothetical protein [Chlamydiales bacterium]